MTWTHPTDNNTQRQSGLRVAASLCIAAVASAAALTMMTDCVKGDALHEAARAAAGSARRADTRTDTRIAKRVNSELGPVTSRKPSWRSGGPTVLCQSLDINEITRVHCSAQWQNAVWAQAWMRFGEPRTVPPRPVLALPLARAGRNCSPVPLASVSPSSSSSAFPAMRAQRSTAAAAKRSQQSKATPAAAAAERMDDDDAVESGAAAAAAPAASSSSSGASSFSVSAFLAGLGGCASPAEETAAAAHLRTLQHAIMKQANTRAADLLHPELWPAFLARMQALPANTVRIDVHLLNAVSRTLAECIAHTKNRRAAADDATDSFALLPTLQRLLQLLLPADNVAAGVSVSESWASTFHPNYELTSAFIGGLLRMVPRAEAEAPAEVTMSDLPPSVWRFLSAALSAFALINAQQTSQRKVYEHALLERNLPVWASVHQAMQSHVQRVRQEAQLQHRRLTADQHAHSVAMRECATKLEQCITGVLFHPEHLTLYADALGFKNVTAKEESDEEEQKEIPAAEAEETAAADEPAGKKAKTDPADSKSASRKKGASTAAAGAAHKPPATNFTHKLFEAVQGWIARDASAGSPAAAAAQPASTTATVADAKSASKKRKTASAADDAPAAAASAPSSSAAAAAAVPVSSRAIRALLPLLFSGFVSSSEAAYLALYPAESSSHELSTLETRRKKVKEALKSERELKFLQRMWAINEGATADAAASSGDALVSPVFSAPLSSLSQLSTLHDMFTTSASLFRLVSLHGIYKINQDANASSGSFTGFKKHLANQMHAIMAVVRNLIVASQASASAAAGAKSSKSKSSSSSKAIVLSKVDLLSLVVPLATNLQHLLSLNPEFLSRYLYVRSTKSNTSTSSASATAAEVNVWHLVWKVVQLSTDLTSVSSLVSSLPSPPGLALPTVRHLSQSILASYSKSRSMETLFNSYLSAARSAATLDPSLPIQPFATMCGPAFDTSSLMRSVPVLKVPSLWEWFLTQSDRELTSDAEASSPETQQALLHFFVYFLDTLLVREEIAVQLQALIGKTMQAIIAQPLRTVLQQHLKSAAAAAVTSAAKSAKGSKSKSKKATAEESAMSDVPAPEAASKLPLSCLLLLLHSLNDLTAQCAQHLEKTYETMLQPLVGYFHAIDSAASAADGEGSSSSSAAEEMRLTEVIASLTASPPDASLLYSLHLLAIQRLHQLYRFESRNITTHSGLLEATADSDVDDDDDDAAMDSDGDEKPASKGKKVNGSSNGNGGGVKRAPQTHRDEATALTAFLLQHQSSCRYDASSSAASLDRFSWDGSASSLANDNEPRAATALWFLLAGNLDVVAHFATPAQRQVLVQNVIAISAYTHCDAATAAADQSQPEGASVGPAASPSLHTLRSITSILYTQPWFYEVSVLRPVLMDVALSNLMDTAGRMIKAADKTARKASKDGAASQTSVALTIPAKFTLTTAVAEQLPALRRFAEYASLSAATGAASSSATVSSQSLWDSIWLLQLLHTFPSQYFASSPQFHALIVQITWGIETLASNLSPAAVAAAAGKQPLGEPLSLMEIAKSWQTVDASSLYSHLILASRRMLLSSLNALAISPAASSSALLVSLVSAPLLEWACFGTFRHGGGLLGRHVAFACEATRTALHLITPALLLAGKHKIKATAGELDSAASSEEKKWSKSSKADKSEKSSKAADKGEKGEKLAPISALQPVIEKITAALNGLSGSSTSSDRSDALWCLQLASSLVESFVPGWSAPLHGGSSAASIEALAKSFRTLSRDAPLVFDLLSQLNRAATKQLLPLLSSGSEAGSDDSLLGGTFDLSARLLVNLFAYRMSITSKEKAAATPAAAAAMGAKMDDKLLNKAGDILAAAVKMLTEEDRSASTAARQGAITLVHALCVILPLFQAGAKAPITFASLLDAVMRAMACDAGKRLHAGEGVASPASSSVTNSILAAFASLQSHATPADCAQMVHACLAQLDPSFAHASSITEEASAPSIYARHSGALQLLYVYINHMQTSAQRQAVSHAHVALLLYRLGALSADWSYEYLSRSADSAACVSLATSALTLLSHILSRHQVFILDDASLSLLAQLLNNVTLMLRDSVAKRAATDVTPVTPTSSSFSLFTPFYLCLYSLLKFHPASTIKLVHLFLGSWVRAVLEAQWKKIQHSDPAVEVVPLSLSENAARLLEEVGKPSHSKLFNHYAVGVLLDWINLSKTKGVGWGSTAQEKHVKAIQRGIYAIINICEEHESENTHIAQQQPHRRRCLRLRLSFCCAHVCFVLAVCVFALPSSLAQLHNLLDASGRTIFRALHQAYKKTKFTGLV